MHLDYSFIPQLGKTTKLLDLYVEDKLSNSGIPLSKLQFDLLKIISKHQGKNQCTMAELSGRDKTTFTRIIGTLERKDLVERNISRNDKRVKEVSITKSGEELLKKSNPIVTEILNEIESELSSLERDQFLGTLKIIKNKLSK